MLLDFEKWLRALNESAGNSLLMQRWLASTLLYAETRFRKIKGYQSISEVQCTIQQLQKNKTMEAMKSKMII